VESPKARHHLGSNRAVRSPPVSRVAEPKVVGSSTDGLADGWLAQAVIDTLTKSKTGRDAFMAKFLDGCRMTKYIIFHE
jgi:hypothetical protein